MAFNFKIKSISSLNRRLNKFLIGYILILLLITSGNLAAFFHSYDNNSYQLAKNNTENRASKFLSTYEHEIISIASQPTFRNLLGADQNMLKSMDINNPFYYGLKRQIASLTAKYKKNTMFEGTKVINNLGQVVLTQGLTESPYNLVFKLCYRDSLLSYKKGTPCIGSWIFYINKKKLLKNLEENNLQTTTLEEKNIPIHSLFHFDVIKLDEKNLFQNIFLKVNIQNKYIKYIISLIIFTLFISMIILAKFILNIYKINYFDFISKIHSHLNKNKLLEKNEYKESPDEISNLVLAVNKTIRNRKAEAVENLAHDLNPPLKRLQNIASKLEGSLKQDILNIHTQCYIAINKLHTTTLENMDVKKSIYDCISSIYIDQYNKEIITINTNCKNLFFRGSYSHFIRVISNLLDNALKATSCKKTQRINVHLYEEDFFIKIDIEDNGQGIIQKKLKNIFMDGVSFTGSSGRGLSYCKKTIESWRGTINCRSTKEVGTTFSISIPKSKAPFDFIENIFYNKKSRFILIDDELHFHAHLSRKIPNNHKIINIHTINELKSFFSKNISSSDIFIVDYHFSEDVNGLEIINKYNLFGNAYLISSSADFIKELHQDYRAIIPILSKEHLSDLKFLRIDNKNAILVDDDTEILHDALEISKIKKIDLLPLNNFLQLKMASKLIHKSTPITLDNNIEDIDEKGTNLAKTLYECGFSELYLQTGEHNIKQKYNFLKKLSNKGEFYYGKS